MNAIITHDTEAEPDVMPYAASIQQIQVHVGSESTTLYRCDLLWGEAPETFRKWAFSCVVSFGDKPHVSFESLAGETLEEAIANYPTAYEDAKKRNMEKLRSQIIAVRASMPLSH